MKNRLKKLAGLLLTGILAVSCLAGCGNTNGSEDGLSITVSHQPYSHGLSSYIGEQEGTFEANGVNVNILWFDGGSTQNEALGANEWEAGCYGSLPAINAGIAYNAKIIAVNVEDSVSLGYWVRSDSDIAQVTGEVAGHPDIYGNADTWRGKTILCATGTSVHFGLIATLKEVGLTPDDVNIVSMDVSSAFAAFKAGEGDVVALWDPQNYYAEEEGWVKVSSGLAVGEEFPTVFVASEEAIENNWDGVYAWLSSYLDISEAYADDINGQASYLMEMQLDNGIETTDELCVRFVEDRPLPTLEKQIEYFSGEEGSRYIDGVMDNVIDFCISQGTHTEEEKQLLHENGFIDSEFIRAIAEAKGIEMN